MENDNKGDAPNDGTVEGRLILDEMTGTFSIEIPSEEGISSDQLKMRQKVSQSFAGMFRDGSRAAMKVIEETPHDSNWAELLVATLEPFGYRVNDEVLRFIQAEVIGKDRDIEIQLRYLLGRIFSARREASLGLEEIERGLALIRSDEAAYALALYHVRANLLCIAGDVTCPDACRRAIQAARALANHHTTANVFRIWSMFHWKRREFDKAIPLFDEATEHLRNVGGAAHAFHLLDTLERVAGLDRERMRRYVDEIISIIVDGRALDETRTAKARLSIAQHLMAAAPTQEERELALKQSVRALKVFRRFVGFEGRAAACSMLLSIEYARVDGGEFP